MAYFDKPSSAITTSYVSSVAERSRNFDATERSSSGTAPVVPEFLMTGITVAAGAWVKWISTGTPGTTPPPEAIVAGTGGVLRRIT